MALALVESALDLGWDLGWDTDHQRSLLQGKVVLETRPHSAWGGAVTAQMFLPLDRWQVWPKLTDYSRWVQYFPSLTQSQVLADAVSQPSQSASSTNQPSSTSKKLYQAAGKTFLFLTAQVEIYLKVTETTHPLRHQIQFQLEHGSFNDFSALLKLQDYESGTLLTYSVQATPSIPIPTQIIQEGIRLDLPNNMRSMRRAICQ